METYREKLATFFSARDCHSVTYENQLSSGVHAHWQVIAVPKSISNLEEEFVQGFQDRQMTLEQREPAKSEEYCRVVLPSGSYVATLPERYDLQFPRRILAKLFCAEERVDWRSCIQSEDEERADAEAFRGEFEQQASVTQES